MRVEVMEHYGLTQSIEQAGYYETAHHKQLMKDIKGFCRINGKGAAEVALTVFQAANR